MITKGQWWALFGAYAFVAALMLTTCVLTRVDPRTTAVGRFDVSVHYGDATLKVYTILDTVYCKNYIATTAGGLEFLEVNKPCLNRKKPRNQ